MTQQKFKMVQLSHVESVLNHWSETAKNYGFDGDADNYQKILAEISAAPDVAGIVESDSYVQPVPDHCDRITWRGNYYHLPLQPSRTAELEDKVKRLVEASHKLIEENESNRLLHTLKREKECRYDNEVLVQKLLAEIGGGV